MSSCPRRSSRGSRLPRRLPPDDRPVEPSPAAGCARLLPALASSLIQSSIWIGAACRAGFRHRPTIRLTLLPIVGGGRDLAAVRRRVARRNRPGGALCHPGSVTYDPGRHWGERSDGKSRDWGERSDGTNRDWGERSDGTNRDWGERSDGKMSGGRVPVLHNEWREPLR